MKKNGMIFGLIIGVLSALWLFIMFQMGYTLEREKIAPIEYASVLIPVLGLLIGIKDYRDNHLNGSMSFFEGLIQSFRILILGGAIAVFAGIVYINYIVESNNFQDFSGRMFGALLIGVLSALGVSLLYANKSSKID